VDRVEELDIVLVGQDKVADVLIFDFGEFGGSVVGVRAAGV
jgi:hypothetical protein